MTIFTNIAAFIAAVAFPLLIWQMLVVRQIAANDKFKEVAQTLRKNRRMNEQLYQFLLTRKIAVPGSYPRAVVSTMTIELGTDDPFRTREVIFKNFPGWMVSFESPTDREYQREIEEAPRRILEDDEEGQS